MSIYILRSVHVKLYRRALALANHAAAPQPTLKCFRRSSHNDLYQMVKKRTLEARTKLQPSKFPNSHASVSASHSKIASNKCISGASAKPQADKTASCPKLDAPCAAMQTKPQPTIEASNRQASRDASKTKNICQNTKVLNSDDCLKSRRTGGQGGGGGGDGKDGDKYNGSDEDEANRKRKLLWAALLAVLGAGGLLYWLLARRDKDKCAPKDSACKDGSAAGGAGGAGDAAGTCNEATIDSKYSTTCQERIPACAADLPKHVPYLLIGAGAASFSAYRAIKANDAKAKVLMITDEFRKPYMRPPLSKELWSAAQPGVAMEENYRFKEWTGAERSLYFEPEQFFIDPRKLMDSPMGGVSVAQGFRVKKVDAAKHIAILSDGTEIGYEECLIAPGCRSRGLKVFKNSSPAVREKVMVFRTAADFERLKKYADQKKSITIVGNGFTGSELSCSLANYTKERGVRIYQVFPETANMSKVLPTYLSNWTTKKIEEMGVCIIPNSEIVSVERKGPVLNLVLSNGNSVITDIVVQCVGCEPNTDIAVTSGLETHRNLGGFVVNAELEARRNLFVAGDACCFYDQLLGRRRVEHHDNSIHSGRLAGENMVGKKKAYQHQSMFWSDLGNEIGFEGIGLVDGALPTVGIFALPSKHDRKSGNLAEPKLEVIECDPNANDKELSTTSGINVDSDSYGRGVVFYFKDNKIVGILLWNLFNRIDLARTIITQKKKYEDLYEVAKLFQIDA